LTARPVRSKARDRVRGANWRCGDPAGEQEGVLAWGIAHGAPVRGAAGAGRQRIGALEERHGLFLVHLREAGGHGCPP